MIDSPSGRVPEKASRWDRGRTETCGGGKFVSSGSLGVLEYLGIYNAGIRSYEATRGPQGIRVRPVAESATNPQVVLVINNNIYAIELMPTQVKISGSSMIGMARTIECGPLKMLRTWIGKSSRLYIFD